MRSQQALLLLLVGAPAAATYNLTTARVPATTASVTVDWATESEMRLRAAMPYLRAARHPGRAPVLQPPSLTSRAAAAAEMVTHTAATVEVDVMPFLGRADWGGPFNAYYEALANLGSEYVRYAPWFPNPRVVVTELTPSDCTATKPATNWNSTYFDAIMRDFMAAVCGPNAVTGECKLSVVQQLSTMPSWMYVGGFCPDPEGCLPDYPWNTTSDFGLYASGSKLKDPTCGEMARYYGRLVGHYTSGGHFDECGHWHPSGFNYTWWGTSVLNEDEHHIAPDDGTAYTTCYDAIMAEIRNPKNGAPVGLFHILHAHQTRA
jgi:hypothetical protein